MTPRHERALIKRTLAGDRAAAEELVRGHQASLFAYMLRITGRPDVAEDVVQEAFFRALTHLERYNPRFRFSTWLFTIAKRLHVNASQRLKPAYDTDIVSSQASRGSSPLTPTQHDERGGHVRDALDRAVQELSEDQREVVILFYQLSWSVEQISEYLDQPEGTIKSHLHRARARMRTLLEQDELWAPRLKEALA